jgi:murein tripeptide amidase MpaA
MDHRTELEQVKHEVSQLDNRMQIVERKLQWVEAVAKVRGWRLGDSDNSMGSNGLRRGNK